MTRRIGNTVFLEDEPPGVCAFCKQLAELRPYGPNNERICYDCGQKDPETTMRKMDERFAGADIVLDIGDGKVLVIKGEEELEKNLA